jgi:putative membrane protein
MPDTFQTKIDDLMDEYTGSDFKPVSFLSSRNLNTGLVQFVLKCDAIEKPEATAKAPAERKDETIWDRVTALFKIKEQ